MRAFPKNFFWGAAASAYQVEGDNFNCDWWEWEKRVALPEPSGRACRHYELFREDFQLARSLGHNAHRLSIEWSRVQGGENEFSPAELEHYLQVIRCLRENNLEPIVTLHHFTNPAWFTRSGGWENKHNCRHFLRYCEKVVELLAGEVRFWVTINEPMVYTYNSYLIGSWPPQKRSLRAAAKVKANLAEAHICAYRLIREIYKRKGLAPPAVSIAHNLRCFMPCGNSLKNKLAAYLRDREFNFSFLEKLLRYNSLDFIGVNYYTRDLVDIRGWGLRNLFFDLCAQGHDPVAKNSLGWDIYPRGLYELLLKLKPYRLPVFILENGICTGDDQQRWDFIRGHLQCLRQAMEQGVEVLGYLYWSLLDNFEWDKGFKPRFGLVEVDYQSFKRTPRESARKFSALCQGGEL